MLNPVNTWIVPMGDFVNQDQEEREWIAKNTVPQAPEGVALRVGDLVEVVNGLGRTVYGFRVGGFSTGNANGGCIHLVGPELYPYWFPVKPENVKKA